MSWVSCSKLSACPIWKKKKSDSARFAPSARRSTLRQARTGIKVLFMVSKAALGSFNSGRWAVRDFSRLQSAREGSTEHVRVKTLGVPGDKYLYGTFTSKGTVERRGFYLQISPASPARLLMWLGRNLSLWNSLTSSLTFSPWKRCFHSNLPHPPKKSHQDRLFCYLFMSKPKMPNFFWWH